MPVYRILYADNDIDSLKLIRKFLEKNGYVVDIATNPEEARARLTGYHYDLAIIDMRLTDDSETTDKSGLKLAREVSPSIPKLIYTKFPNISDARESMMLDLSNQSPAVGYVDKAEGLEGLRDAIEKVIRSYVGANEKVVFNFYPDKLTSFFHLVTLVISEVGLTDITQLANELEVLIRKVFNKYEQVSFSRILWRMKNKVMLQVNAFRNELEEQYLVTVGIREQLNDELQIYQEYVPTQQVNVPSLDTHSESHHFGVVVWTIKGADIDPLQTLGNYLLVGSEKNIRETLETFFATLHENWGSSRRQYFRDRQYLDVYLGSEGIFTRYQDTLTILAENLVKLSVEKNILPLHLDDRNLYIQYFPNQDSAYIYPNPVKFLFERQNFPDLNIESFILPSKIDLETFLVDDDARVWVTDFSQITQAFSWQPHVSLETEVRYGLIPYDELFTVLDFEEEFLMTQSLGEDISIRKQPYSQAMKIILSIRHIATKYIDDNLTVYYIGLLFNLSNSFLSEIESEPQLSKKDIKRGLYKLILMAMLCKKLQQHEDNDENRDLEDKQLFLTIRENERRKVWVGNKVKSLTNSQWNLILLLYKKNGQVCSYEEILRELFNNLPDTRGARSTIAMHISRLREKIEPSLVNEPVFIINVPGEGYYLNITGD